MIFLVNQCKAIASNLNDKTYSILRFGLYVLIILASQMSSAVLLEKIYKTPYIRTGHQEGTQASSQTDYFANPFGVLLFNGFFSLCYGFFKYQVLNSNNALTEPPAIPSRQFIKISTLELLGGLFFSLAIIQSSYITVNMIMCCKLLIVVLFAVFFSKSSGRFQVRKSQIYIALFICVGIIIFNSFTIKQSSQINKPLSWMSATLLVLLLVMEGYKPQMVSQIRQKYSPRPSYILYEISKYSFIIVVIVAAVSTYLWKMMVFIWEHDRLAIDLMLHSCLDVFGLIFIYRVIVISQQHIVPMILTVRKLLSALFSIWYFHHNVSTMQFVGIGVVFSAILLELYIGYRENLDNFKYLEQKEQQEPYLGY